MLVTVTGFIVLCILAWLEAITDSDSDRPKHDRIAVPPMFWRDVVFWFCLLLALLVIYF